MSETATSWTDIAVAVTAIIAIFLSAFSLRYARASLLLARAQDRRREPKLAAELLSGDYTVNTAQGSRNYELQLSVRNPTDSDNAIARVELRILYRLDDGVRMTARFPPVQGDGGDNLVIPLRLAAHETIAGRCNFSVALQAVSWNRIDRYDVEITDTHGQVISITPLLLSERRSVQA